MRDTHKESYEKENCLGVKVGNVIELRRNNRSSRIWIRKEGQISLLQLIEDGLSAVIVSMVVILPCVMIKYLAHRSLNNQMQRNHFPPTVKFLPNYSQGNQTKKIE